MEDKSRSENRKIEERLSQALAAEEIGLDVVFAGLSDLDALDVRVDDEMATVTVTLPIASADFRRVVEHDIRTVAQGVVGIQRVDCRFDPTVLDPGARVEFAPGIKNIVAVGSGKGGVGKSTVAVNLAVALADAGASVGLLDADIYGPNAPAMLGLTDHTPEATLEDRIVPRQAHGVSVMSMGFIVGEDDPVIWRGPLVDEFLQQLFGDVEWGELDYLVVDLPPGTGDAHLSLVQHLPVTGAAIVTTPQQVAVDDARRGLRGFARYDVPILGLVENMANFECPDCGSTYDIFGTGGAEQIGAEFDVPVLGRIPLDQAIGTLTRENDESDGPGVSVPGLGRLHLPRTREERDKQSALPPIVRREDGGSTRRAFEVMATRTVARLNSLIVSRRESH